MRLKKFILSNPYFSLLHTAWHYAKNRHRRYLAIYGLFSVSNIMMSLYPIIWGLFINELQLEGINALRSAWMYAGAYLLLHFIDWSAHGPARVMERKLAFDVSRNFLHELYQKTLYLPVKWHQDHHSGATINRIRKAYEALKEFFDNGFMYFQTVAKMVLALAAMVYFSPLFGGIALGIGVIVVIVILKFDRPFIAASMEVNEREHEVSANLFDSLSNILTVITLRLEKRMEQGLDSRIAAVFPPFVRKTLINEWKWFTVDSCVKLMYVIILVGYLYQNWIPGEVFLVGGLVTLIGYVNQFSGAFHNFAWQYTTIVRYDTDVKTAFSIVEAFDQNHRPETKSGLLADWKTIDLQHLNFVHREGWIGKASSVGLYDLSIRIQRGTRIALIGESGSGKSTLLALLRGLYAPAASTQVMIDGKAATHLGSIADHVTLFPQEPEIFENSIEYNITLGLPFEQENLDRVCETAHFTEVIQQLPQGLASNIQEKGVNLSGGQKQRLALARGVLAAQDSHLVLLDEPTSSVDPKTEMLIYDKLFETFADKAVISALHRLHLLAKFDYVYILDKGKIVDQGSFAQLKAQSAVFQELWRHQEERAVL